MTPTTRQLAGLFFDAGGAVINVKHPKFGAKGDGTTPDDVAIQKAIVDADLASRPHGLDDPPAFPAQNTFPTIVFPPGNYLLNQSLDFPTGYLRVVGLGNANLVKGNSFTGTAAWITLNPFQVSFEGMSFIGFPTGLDLGHDGYNVATATTQLVRCNFLGCGTGLHYESRSSLLNIVRCKFIDNDRHIDIDRCDIVHLKQCYVGPFTPQADGHTGIRVNLGRLHVQGGYFMPGPVTTKENAWIEVDNAGLIENEGAHIGLIAHGVRAGDESNGLTFVNFRATPDKIFPGNEITRVILRDSQLEPGQGGYADRPECVVRLWQVPNHLEITGCHWTDGRPVDWASGVAVTPAPDHHNERLVYRVENNCDNGWPTVGSVPGNRTRRDMPSQLEDRANLLGGIRRGTKMLASNATVVTVDLLSLIPGTEILPIRAQDISVRPLGTLGNASSWWVGTVDATSFEIRTNIQPGGAGINFAWSVDLRRY